MNAMISVIVNIFTQRHIVGRGAPTPPFSSELHDVYVDCVEL